MVVTVSNATHTWTYNVLRIHNGEATVVTDALDKGNYSVTVTFHDRNHLEKI